MERIESEVLWKTALVTNASNIAHLAHAGQKDLFGRPYISHVFRVAKRALDNDYSLNRADVAAVALLHDVVEDSDWRVDDLFVLGGIDPAIAAVVLILTRNNRFDKSYAEYIQRIARSGNELAIAVKIADLEDHLDESLDDPRHPNYKTLVSLRKRYKKAHSCLVEAQINILAKKIERGLLITMRDQWARQTSEAPQERRVCTWRTLIRAHATPFERRNYLTSCGEEFGQDTVWGAKFCHHCGKEVVK